MTAPGAILARTGPTAGIQTVPVDYRPVVREPKTVGYVAFDESRPVAGCESGGGLCREAVRGQDLCAGSIRATRWPRSIVRSSKHRPRAGVGHARGWGAPTWAAGCETGCELLGVGRQEIDAIAASGQASPRLVLRSPQTGYVVDKKIVVGSSVERR